MKIYQWLFFDTSCGGSYLATGKSKEEADIRAWEHVLEAETYCGFCEWSASNYLDFTKDTRHYFSYDDGDGTLYCHYYETEVEV